MNQLYKEHVQKRPHAVGSQPLLQWDCMRRNVTKVLGSQAIMTLLQL